MSTEEVFFEKKGSLGLITLNRPEALNALTLNMVRLIHPKLKIWEEDNEIKTVAVTAVGDKAFCAGGDIAAMKERLAAPQGKVALNGWKRQRRTHHAVTMLHELSIPTIAAVNGPAAGLGADLALSCDFVISSRDAFFVFSYVMRGLIPDGGGMYFLPRRVGLARAKELIFSARRVPAEEALAINMIESVSEPDALIDDAVAMADSLRRWSVPAALRDHYVPDFVETNLKGQEERGFLFLVRRASEGEDGEEQWASFEARRKALHLTLAVSR